MQEARTASILDRLAEARRRLSEAEQSNAAATLARRPPPYTVDQVRQLEYAVADIAEEAYGGDVLSAGPHARRLTFPAVS